MSKDRIYPAVPEGWEIVPFCQPDEILQGLTYSPENVKDYGLLVLRSSNIQNGRLVFDDNVYVDRRVNSGHLVRKGDIIICVRNGSSALIGKCAIAERDYDATWGAFMACVRSDRNEFLYQIFQSGIIQKQIHGKSNATINQITNRDFREMAIPLPPLSEQHAIAETLSDVDEYIASLEKLIAKKKAIKQGAMQELLTGKRRLPGFDGEWVNFYLSKNSIVKARIGWQGLTTAEYSNEGYAFLVTGTDFMDGRIDWNSCYYVDKLRYDQDVNIQIINNDILITKDGTVGKVAMVNGLKKNGTLNSGIFVIRPINFTYDNLFVYYILSSQIFAKFIAKLSAGSTINHLYQKDFVDFSFLLPPVIEEQKVVAGILLDMDAEIETLAAKLNKAKSIKQGMMQELLTGRIRLVKPKTAVIPATKIIEQAYRNHIEEDEETVILVALVNAFGTEQHPFTAFDRQKFPYLFHRHVDGVANGYKKFPAGPYNPDLKYRTAMPDAVRKGYIREWEGLYKGVIIAENATEILKGFTKKYGDDPLKWMERFRYIKNRKEELELLTTVDKAMVELRCAGVHVTVSAVKEIIENSNEWKAKLKREIFSDENISRAIKWSIELFGEEASNG